MTAKAAEPSLAVVSSDEPFPTITAEDLTADLRPDLEHLRTTFEIAVPDEWDESLNYTKADQPKEIASILIGRFHPHLDKAKILYVYRQKFTRESRPSPGSVQTIAGLHRFTSKLDFALTINWTLYQAMTGRSRIALMDHLLCQAWKDPESGTWKRQVYDVEEFLPIIERWGAWEDGSKVEELTAHLQQLKLDL